MGGGPGEFELLTLKAVSLIKAADLVVIDPLFPKKTIERIRNTLLKSHASLKPYQQKVTIQIFSFFLKDF